MALVGALWPWRLTPPAPEQGLPSWRAEVRNSTVAVEEGLDSNYGGWHDADMLRWEGVYVAKCCELVNKVHVFIRFSFQVQCRYRYISIKTYMLSFTWSPEYLTHDCQRSSARQKKKWVDSSSVKICPMQNTLNYNELYKYNEYIEYNPPSTWSARPLPWSCRKLTNRPWSLHSQKRSRP